MRTDRVPYADVASYLKSNDTVLVPVGATECYGPHLAMGTELRICEMFATAVGEKTGLAVVPVVPFNYSHMFLEYPGTCSVEMAAVKNYVGQACEGLAGQGFRRFLFVNVHNGSLGPLEGVSRTLRRKFGAMGGLIDVFTVMREKGGVTFETKLSPTAHAAEMVTSVALHLFPDMVFMDRAASPELKPPPAPGTRSPGGNKLVFDGGGHIVVFADMADDSPSGHRDDPRPATAAKGKQLWDNAVEFGARAATTFSTMRPLGAPA